MRPVERGPAPAQFGHYSDAAKYLYERLGRYCSYCERHLEVHLAVEHVLPQSLYPAKERDWDNFLLACSNCNSCKGDTDIRREEYLWPDQHNTLLAFRYQGMQVLLALAETHPAYPQAQGLLQLMGLDRLPGSRPPPTETDHRWKTRSDVWDMALRQKARLENNNNDAFRATIIELAQAKGCFSIWYAIFANDADMCQRLQTAFPGTSALCFRGAQAIPKAGQVL